MVADLAQVTSPLVTKQLIYFVTDSGYAMKGVPGYISPPVSKGVGLVIALFILQCIYSQVQTSVCMEKAEANISPIFSSVCTAQMFSRSGQCGILARAALIAAVYRRAMVMSGKSRGKFWEKFPFDTTLLTSTKPIILELSLTTVQITNSKLVSHISTDISRIDLYVEMLSLGYSTLSNGLQLAAPPPSSISAGPVRYN